LGTRLGSDRPVSLWRRGGRQTRSHVVRISCRIVTALLLKLLECSGVQWSTFANFLPNAKHLSAVDKSAFTYILGRAVWSHA